MKALIMTEVGEHKTVELPGIPSIGHTIPLFYYPYPKVVNVVWLPEGHLIDDIDVYDVDILITVE